MRPSKWKNVLSKWEQEVRELGWGARAPALCPCQDRSTAWVSGSGSARFSHDLGSWSKQPEDGIFRAKRTLLIPPKQSSREVYQNKKPKGEKKNQANQAESASGKWYSQPVGKGWPAWAHCSLCAALLPLTASTLALVPVSPWWIGSEMPIRGLQDCRRLMGLPPIILIFTCCRGWYSLTTFLLAPAVLVGRCLTGLLESRSSAMGGGREVVGAVGWGWVGGTPCIVDTS